MTFLPGQSGNPNGRPTGAVSGRSKAVQLLDALLADEKNQAILADALKTAFRKNPVRFFTSVIVPLLPKASLAVTETQGTTRWISLIETYPTLPEAKGQ